MNKKLLIVRITLWWGIIADTLEGIRMLFPTFFLSSTGLNLYINKEFAFGLMYGAPVMLGWSVILFWADRQPIKRKGVLYCLIPVIIGYIVIDIIQTTNGLISIEKILPVMIMKTALLSLSVLSIIFANKMDEQNG